MENETFRLIVKRESQFTNAAGATRVRVGPFVDNKFYRGESKTYTLPMRPVEITIDNQVSIGKNVKKTITVDPAGYPAVEVRFRYRLNWVAFIFPMCFFVPGCFIDTEVNYGSGAPLGHPSYPPRQPFVPPRPVQPQQPPKLNPAQPTNEPLNSHAKGTTPSGDGNVKYCTQCGKQNPGNAVFCGSCGKKF